MLSRALEKTLHRALAYANERRHEYATIEHLLLALTEDEDAVAVLRACDINLERLQAELRDYLQNELANLITDRPDDAKPTAGFQRVLQRAAVHVQSSGREEVNGANVLVALFSEKESHAVYFLQEQEMARFDAVQFMSTGVAKSRKGLSIKNEEEKKVNEEEFLGFSTEEISTKNFSKDLKESFDRMLNYASKKNHHYILLDHILILLLDDPISSVILKLCRININRMREEVENYLEGKKFIFSGPARNPVISTIMLQNVLKSANKTALDSGSATITGADILVALFTEPKSHAANFLARYASKADIEAVIDILRTAPLVRAGKQEEKPFLPVEAASRRPSAAFAAGLGGSEAGRGRISASAAAVSGIVVPGLGSNPVAPDRFKLLVDDAAALNGTLLNGLTGLSLVGESRRLRFATVRRVADAPDELVAASLQQLGNRNGLRVAPEFRYELESQLGFDPHFCEAWLEGDGEPAKASLDDVLRRIGADRITYPRSNRVVIAIVDSGIDGTRLEFCTPIKQAGGWAPPGIDPWKDKIGHGTMCACIAAGTRESGGRFQGVAPLTPILSCRVPGLVDGDLALVYDLLTDMAEAGSIVVVSNSFGRVTAEAPVLSDNMKFPAALDNAVAAGVHVVFSAGNNHPKTEAAPNPCTPNTIWLHKGRADVLTVGTCDLNGKIWDYSSRGPGQFPGKPGQSDKPDVVAPTPSYGLIAHGNQNIVARRGWGTSGAAPQVAGLLAILLSLNPDIRRQDLFDLVRRTAVPQGNGRYCEGHGMIDCVAAVSALDRV